MYGGSILKEIMKQIKEFNEERDWDQFHSPENLAKSISIEAGELLECFQWNSENYNKNVFIIVMFGLSDSLLWPIRIQIYNKYNCQIDVG